MAGRPREKAYVFVRYDDTEVLWHEHLAVARVGASLPDSSAFVILTVDGDVYAEDLTAPPHVAVRWGTLEHTLPDGLGRVHRQPVYRFSSAVSDAALRRVEAQVKAALEEARRERGLDAAGRPVSTPPPVGGGVSLPLVPVGPGGMPPMAPEQIFAVVLGTAAVPRGSQVTPQAGDLLMGGFALVAVADGTVVASCCQRAAAESHIADLVKGRTAPPGVFDDGDQAESEDVRTLPVMFERTGERFRPFEDAVAIMTEEPFPEEEWPIEGPRSALWWLKGNRRLGLTPVGRHQKWAHESGIAATDRSIHEHELLSSVIELAATVDQLNLSSLASFEMLVRRIQFIEEAHVISPQAPVYEAAEHWLGTGRKKGGVLISPLLAKHVADRVKDETAVSKERRKAREERVLNPKVKAKAKAGAGKGDSKGGDAGDG